jgi:sugar phosphate permease
MIFEIVCLAITYLAIGAIFSELASFSEEIDWSLVFFWPAFIAVVLAAIVWDRLESIFAGMKRWFR